MVAGDSAGAESRRQLALAEAHERAAADARAAAGRYGIAEVTENWFLQWSRSALDLLTQDA